MVAGLDLGDKRSFVCLIDLDRKIVERKKLRTSPPAFSLDHGEPPHRSRGREPAALCGDVRQLRVDAEPSGQRGAVRKCPCEHSGFDRRAQPSLELAAG